MEATVPDVLLDTLLELLLDEGRLLLELLDDELLELLEEEELPEDKLRLLSGALRDRGFLVVDEDAVDSTRTTITTKVSTIHASFTI